jgi:hypothetical protein
MDGSYLDSGDIKLQGEMASVEQVDFGIRKLALEPK